MKKGKTFGLETLLGPLKVQDFMSNHWRANRPAVVKSSLDRFSAFPYLFDALELEKLAERYYGRVSMIHPDGRSIDVQTGKEAIPYLRQGYTVYFRHIQKYFPEFDAVLNRIASDVGMPPDMFTSEIFTSSGESGVPFHSDYDLNLSLLIAGERKEWTYAENKSIANQTGICMPAGVEQIEPAQMEFLTTEPLPAQLPSNATTSVLTPGDLIFMPRGWWHTTHSIGNCIAINFVMKGPHLARLFTSALEKKLLTSKEWRAYPYGIRAAGSEKEMALQALAKLTEDLKLSLFTKTSDEIASELADSY